MYKKTLLILFALLTTAHAQLPMAPPTVHQFKVHYACQGSNESRNVLVDADSAEEARAIIQDMIPCAIIIKITEVLLYEE